MTTKQKLAASRSLLDDRSKSARSAELSVLRLHQEALEALSENAPAPRSAGKSKSAPKVKASAPASPAVDKASQ